MTVSRWLQATATVLFGVLFSIIGLVIDKRSEDRKELEFVMTYFSICYAGDEAKRIAGAQTLKQYLEGLDDTDVIDAALGLVVESNRGDIIAIGERLLQDPEGCAVPTAEPLNDVVAAPTSEVDLVVLESQASNQSVDMRATRAAEKYVRSEEWQRADVQSAFFPRLFVHTTRRVAPAVGDRAAQDLGGELWLSGDLVSVQGSQHVDDVTLSGSQLRFLKSADEQDARALHAQLSEALGQELALVDLSAQYDENPRVRPRTFELWLAP